MREPPGKLRCIVRVVEPVGEHEELVAAESSNDVGGTHGGPEPRGDSHEQLVAGFVAEGVVDVLEVVDVDEDDSDVESRVRREPGARLREPVEEVLPVRQPRQRVVHRATNKLCLRRFRPSMFSTIAVRWSGRPAPSRTSAITVRHQIGDPSCARSGVRARTLFHRCPRDP